MNIKRIITAVLLLTVFSFVGCNGQQIQPDYAAAYASVLDEYRAFVERGEEGISEELADPWRGLSETIPRTSKEDYGYGIKDMNGDGIAELVLLVKYTYDSKDNIDVYAIYSLFDGKPNLLGSYWSRSCCVIAEDGTIYHQESGGAGYARGSEYKIADGGTELITLLSITMDHLPDGTRKNYTIDDDSNEIAISDEEADALWEQFWAAQQGVTDDYNDAAAGIEFIPLFENLPPQSTRAELILNAETLLQESLPELLSQYPAIGYKDGNYFYLNEDNRVIILAKGNLNGDDTDDFAVVVEIKGTEEQDEFNMGDRFGRHIYAFVSNSDGNYDIIGKSGALILEEWQGGILGDPLESISVENGIIGITHYGGSAYRWGYAMFFEYREEQLRLAKMTELAHTTFELYAEEIIYDFMSCKTESYALNSYDESDPEKTLLYSGDLPQKTFLFNDVSFGELQEFCDNYRGENTLWK